MKILKEADIATIQRESREKGFREGIEFTIKELLTANLIIFEENTGYGACMKLSMSLQNPEKLSEFVSKVFSQSSMATEQMKSEAPDYQHFAKDSIRS